VIVMLLTGEPKNKMYAPKQTRPEAGLPLGMEHETEDLEFSCVPSFSKLLLGED
jgi:hypothetical protein